jgi:hypothetical protein
MWHIACRAALIAFLTGTPSTSGALSAPTMQMAANAAAGSSATTADAAGTDSATRKSTSDGSGRGAGGGITGSSWTVAPPVSRGWPPPCPRPNTRPYVSQPCVPIKR